MPPTSLQFAQPVWIAIGLAVCAGMLALFIRFDRRRNADLAKIIHPRFRQRLTEGFSPRLRNLKRALWLLAILATFIAVARPQKGYEWREVKRRGIDILFAIDTSRSMLAEDLSPNRLERARLGILDFVERLEGDRVGLLPFAGSAFALCPLTLDYGAFRESLDAIDTDLIPRQGTDLASAIREAERLFDENGNNHRILVLITDGEDLQGDVIDTARAAAKNGMTIHTVGVGNPGGSPIPIRHQNGRRDFVRDQDGKVVQTQLDESTLKAVASETDGLYVPLGRGAEGLNTIYQEKLRLVPKSELNQRMERIPLERFEWPLGAAIALLVLDFFLSDRRRVKKQRALPSAARRKAVASLTLLAALPFMPDAAHAAEDNRVTYNQGTGAYLSGDFETAAQSLRRALRTPDLSLQQRTYYNLGNTLYRSGQATLEKDPETTIKSWEESIKAYDDSLSLNQGDDDARYNRDLVQKKLDELKQQQNQQDEQQDQEQNDEENEDQEEQEDQDQQEENQNQENQSEDQQQQDQQQSGDSGEPEDRQQQDGGQNEQDPQERNQQGEDSDQQEQDPSKEGEQEQQETEGGEPEESREQEAESSATEREQRQEMTAEEARQLLEALAEDERTVIPIPQQRRSRILTPNNSTKGKTW